MPEKKNGIFHTDQQKKSISLFSTHPNENICFSPIKLLEASLVLTISIIHFQRRNP